ncbi:MAG: sigma-70 family RNA polymerase sigma factor [Kiritimatiellae bacterium]|nr:sigma-70 family RNA polymerase sigma factor [Kiritimatiellia bacterium]
MNSETKTLIERARRGDMDAFAVVFEDLRPMAYAVACRLVGPDEAEDVVMESYLKAWQAVPTFKGRSSVKTWLYRITYNCGLDFVRARQRRKERVLSGEEDSRLGVADMPDEVEPGPDGRLQQSELNAEIGRALAQLPAEHRVTLQLRFADGLSYAEIAAATGVSIGTVMSRLFNGKRKLRRILEAGE